MASEEARNAPDPARYMEPDEEIDDEGYAYSASASYVTSIASQIRRGIEENGRIYAAYGQHKPWLPVDEAEVCVRREPLEKTIRLADFARPSIRWIGTIFNIANLHC
jgi:hypothetical protein